MTLTPTGFWFLRHGETDWNLRARAQGNVETALNKTGLAQAYRAAAQLRGHAVQTLFSSPLQRARQTADIVAEAIGLIPTIEPDLREASYGVQEGFPMSDWFDDWVAGRSTPQGAESFTALSLRAVRTLNRCLAAPSPVLIVSHGAFFRAIRAAMGLERNIRTPNATPLWCDRANGAWLLTPLG